MMDGLGSGGLPCSGGSVAYGGPVDHSVGDQLQHGNHADAAAAAAAAAATQQHQVASSSPHVGVHAVSAYTEQAGRSVGAAGGASAAGGFGRDMSSGGPPAVVPYSSLAGAPEAPPPPHYPASESLDHHFVGGGVACADAYHHQHGMGEGLPLEPSPPHSAVAGGDSAGMGCGGAPNAMGSPSPALDVSTAASCGGGGPPSEPGGHPGTQQGASPPSHFGGAPEDGSACNGNVPPAQQQPRVGGEAPMRESSADHSREAAAAGGGPPPSSSLSHSHHHPMAAYHAEVPQEQQGESGGGGPSSSAGGPHHPPPESSPGSGAVGMGGGGEPSPFGMQGGGGGRSGIEKYLQWLDAIHTACSKLDDLCSKLDRSFPNATREWDATSPGIRGARQLFQMYATAQQATQQQMHAMGGPSSLHDDIFNANPRKRARRDPAHHAHNGMGGAAGGAHGAGGGLPPQSPGSSSLAHEFAGAAMSMQGGGGAAGLHQMQHAATGAAMAAAMGMGPGGYGAPVDAQLKGTVGGGGGGSPGPSLSLPLSQQCSSPLPGTANVLPPAGVPVGASSLADGAEYEYLLDFPEQEAPDPGKPGDLKCDVAGVYWDKRSWIASWYEGGKRYYKSFSAKTHGFYRSKYWAIKVRLSKVQSHALAGKGLKARATAA
ncbi:hypothetical protein Emed_003604 [Eimeria media]